MEKWRFFLLLTFSISFYDGTYCAFNRCVNGACKKRRRKESTRNGLKRFVIIPYDSVICWDRSWKMGAMQLPFHYVASARMAGQHYLRSRDSTPLLSTARTNDDGCCSKRSSSPAGIKSALKQGREAHFPNVASWQIKRQFPLATKNCCLATPPSPPKSSLICSRKILNISCDWLWWHVV